MKSRSIAFDLGDLAMLATVGIWAANNVIMKAYVDRIGPVPYVFGRFMIVVVLLFAWLAIRGADLRVQREDYGRFFFTGLTGYGIYNLLFTVALSRTTAFSAAVLVGLGPVFTLIITAILKIERVRGRQWAGVACALLGVTVFVGDKLLGSTPAYGDLLTILSAISFAMYTLATRPLVRSYGSPLVTAWSALIGMVITLPVTLPATIDKDWGALGVASWAALFYSAAMSMLVAYTIWGWAIERKGVGRTVPYMYLVPLLTGLLAIIFLDEHMTAIKVIGGGMVLVGVGLARRSITITNPPPEPDAIAAAK